MAKDTRLQTQLSAKGDPKAFRNKQLMRHVSCLKEATIVAMSNMLVANIDSGLSHAIAMGYHQDLLTRGSFVESLAAILKQVRKPTALYTLTSAATNAPPSCPTLLPLPPAPPPSPPTCLFPTHLLVSSLPAPSPSHLPLPLAPPHAPPAPPTCSSSLPLPPAPSTCPTLQPYRSTTGRWRLLPWTKRRLRTLRTTHCLTLR